MKITTSQLRKIIREELQRVLHEDAAPLKNVINAYDDDTMESIPKEKVATYTKSLPVKTKSKSNYEFRIAYDRLVAKNDEGKDMWFWNPDTKKWEAIDDDNRNHPTGAHSWKGKED